MALCIICSGSVFKLLLDWIKYFFNNCEARMPDWVSAADKPEKEFQLGKQIDLFFLCRKSKENKTMAIKG